MVVLRISGIKPAPIPCILCGPAVPPPKTAEDAGSTAIDTIEGSFSLSVSEVPVIVPPVPTAATKISTLLWVSLSISIAVVFL